MNADWMRTIEDAELRAGGVVFPRWSDGTEALVSLGPPLPITPGEVAIGDWGHSLVLASGEEIGADMLWAETLTATGRGDARAFLDWRRRHGLSLAKAAEALGLARRTVAYYSNGDRPVPKAILLACKGWEAGMDLAAAA